jgi:mannose-6-phosphate isomerase-like protein (cupin superfamily)
MGISTVRIVGPRDGKAGSLGSIGARLMIRGLESGGGFALVEHPMPPRALAAPLHRHHREDEYSYILEGRVGADLGGQIVYGEPGDLIFKPRDQWHTFWNAGDEPARLLEIIAPAGFENFFEALVDAVAAGPPDPAALLALAAKYDLDMDLASVPQLVELHGVTFPAAPS